MKNLFLFLILLSLGFGSIFVLSNKLEQNKPSVNESLADEDLYFSAQGLKAVGYDFRGLIADWYWINSLQYLGNKVLKVNELNINDLRSLNPRLVYPMLDTATTLDPKFITVYSYGAAILPAIDNNQAIQLLQKGIRENPDDWRLYHNLGYIYWKSNDFQNASKTYREGSQKPNAPKWMPQMSANIEAQGGSRELALEIYRQMYENAEDEQTKSLAELRFMQVESLDERDAIRPVLQNFQKQNGRCINSWREISNELRAVKLKGNKPLNFNKDFAPIDPLTIPYLIINQNGKCEVSIDWKNSKIPLQ